MTDKTIDYSDIIRWSFKIAFIRKTTSKKLISLRLDQGLIEFYKKLTKILD